MLTASGVGEEPLAPQNRRTHDSESAVPKQNYKKYLAP